jgi:hypothetical protein
MYKTPILRRGLIDAIGTISKTLFGTMDANDARTIEEQLKLLDNHQQTLQHVTENQLKIIDATIGHV